MKTKAAVLLEAGKPFEIMELELDGPGVGEVLIKYTAAGLCHSDLHLIDGDLPPRYPIVGGHEGSGIIEDVGPGVTKVKPGDHVVCSFIPNCGTCRYCSTGRQNLCDMGATILEGCMSDGSFRFHGNGLDFGAMCMLGTFSERATISQHSVVKIDDWLPLKTAVLVGLRSSDRLGHLGIRRRRASRRHHRHLRRRRLGYQRRARGRQCRAPSTSWWSIRWRSSVTRQ